MDHESQGSRQNSCVTTEDTMAPMVAVWEPARETREPCFDDRLYGRLTRRGRPGGQRGWPFWRSLSNLSTKSELVILIEPDCLIKTKQIDGANAF